MVRFFLLLLLLNVLAACTPLLPQAKQAVSQDQLGFSRAMDTFRSTHRIEQLRQFKKDYPDSPWAARAETVILYSLELDQRKADLEKREGLLAEQGQKLKLLEQDNQTLKQENEELAQTNLQLTQQIEQLKGLLIQIEKRAP